MRLISFRVTEFRSVNDSGDVAVAQRTVLVGRNESGKTAILKALHGVKGRHEVPGAGPQEMVPFTLARDFPRDRPRSDFKPEIVVAKTIWELSDNDRREIAKIWPRGAAATRVIIDRQYRALRTISFSGQETRQSVAAEGKAAFEKAARSINTALKKASPEVVQAALSKLEAATRPAEWTTDPRPLVSLSVKRFQCFIQNPIYCGVVIRKWTHELPVRAQGGEYLVSIAAFNAANRGKVRIDERQDGSLRVTYNQSPTRLVKKRHRFSRRWPFKNFAACPTCRRRLWASASRGKSGKYFAAYHCSRGHARYSIRRPRLDKAFISFLEGLRCEARHLDAFRIMIEDEFQQTRSTWLDERSQRMARAAELRVRQNHLARAFVDATSGSIRALLEEQATALDQEIVELERQQPAVDTTARELADFLATSQRLLEHPAEIVENIETFEEQRTILDLFFAELPTPPEIESGTPKLRPTLAVLCELSQVKSANVRPEGLEPPTF